MILVAEIEFNEEGILVQIEKTIRAQSKLKAELYELEKMLQTMIIKEKGDSEESQKN